MEIGIVAGCEDHDAIVAAVQAAGHTHVVIPAPLPPPALEFLFHASAYPTATIYRERRDDGAVRNPCLPQRFKKGSKR